MPGTVRTQFYQMCLIRGLSEQCEALTKAHEAGDVLCSSAVDKFEADLASAGIYFLSRSTGLSKMFQSAEDALFEALDLLESKLLSVPIRDMEDATSLMEYAILRLKDGVLDAETITLLERCLEHLKPQTAPALTI